MDQTFVALQTALAGEYSLEREIGRGGMGIVYLAREVQLERPVAIKVLPAELAARDDVRERFLREARMAAALSHPNIVPIHRVGDADGLPYFVMTFVRGETLGERLRARGPMAPSALIRVMHDVALALGYAHGRGLIHRDVKPDNILLEEGSERALVTDFGIARAASDEGMGEPIMGTAQFMSPEQARGEPLDGRSDIYALGVVAFLSSSGKFPHEGATPMATLAARLSNSAPSITTVAAGIPGPLARTIDRCLATDPSRRFPTAEHVATALESGAAAARSTMPAALREWASEPAPLAGFYALWSTAWGVAAIDQFLEFLTMHRPSYTAGAFVRMEGFGLLAIAPLVPIAIFQLRKTYRALAAGYDVADLRLALRAWIDERRAELATRLGEPRWIRWLRLTPYVSALMIPGTVMTFGLLLSPAHPGGPPAATIPTLIGWAILGITSFALVAGLGISFAPPRLHMAFVGRLRSWLWNSRAGGWIARTLTPATRGVPEAQFRPTEVALSLAVEDLYAALPSAYREMVGDLPLIARRLSHHVGELRIEVERLETLRAHAHHDDGQAADSLLASARGQLGQTITALERMRLELLRLHGGATDTRSLTTSLDAARQMVDDLVRLRDAEAEVAPRSGRRLAIDSRTPSPA